MPHHQRRFHKLRQASNAHDKEIADAVRKAIADAGQQSARPDTQDNESQRRDKPSPAR